MSGGGTAEAAAAHDAPDATVQDEVVEVLARRRWRLGGWHDPAPSQVHLMHLGAEVAAGDGGGRGRGALRGHIGQRLLLLLELLLLLFLLAGLFAWVLR